MDTLALALVSGLLGGGAVAVIGGLITLVVQRRDHAARRAEVAAGQDHERTMAREQRLQDRRARAYERALVQAYRLDSWVERTEPFIGPAPDPAIQPVSLDEGAFVGASTTVLEPLLARHRSFVVLTGGYLSAARRVIASLNHQSD